MIRDREFWLVALAGIGVLIVGGLTIGTGKPVVTGWLAVVSFTLWQPFLEEVLFRGVLQGQLRRFRVGVLEKAGVSLANVLVSLGFVLFHLMHHSPLWALAVFVPSLTFGYFRDRHGSILPGLGLHILFNTGYLLAGLP